MLHGTHHFQAHATLSDISVLGSLVSQKGPAFPAPVAAWKLRVEAFLAAPSAPAASSSRAAAPAASQSKDASHAPTHPAPSVLAHLLRHSPHPKPIGNDFFITTAINYTNGAPHMGHAYEAIIADSLARYHRAFGRNVFFMTGTDEHGQKIANAAEALGVTVRDPWSVFASCLHLVYILLLQLGNF